MASSQNRSPKGLRYGASWIRQHIVQQIQFDNHTEQSETQCPPIKPSKATSRERQVHELMIPVLQRVPIVSRALFRGQTSRAGG